MKPRPAKTSPAQVRKILAALPKTADGVPVWPGVRVFWICGYSGTYRVRLMRVLAVAKESIQAGATFRNWHYLPTYKTRMFSTRAAALAEVKRRNGGAK